MANRRSALCAMVVAVGAVGSAATARSADDTYAFATPAIAVELTRTEQGARASWPAADAGWRTALLGLRVDARGVAAPWIETGAGRARIEQHLDPGAFGLRFLNLSRLGVALADGGEVELRGHGVTILDGPAELHLFSAPDAGGPMLILAPHPDDAEIAAFGLYDGSGATIVTVTSGNAGDFNYRRDVSDPARHYLFKGFLRSVDSVTVPWLGGIPPERAYNLGYFDARLAQMRERPDEAVPEMYGPNEDVSVYRRANIGSLVPKEPRANTWRHLVEDLRTLLRAVRPRRLVAPYPQLDSHLDHQYTTVAAVEALEGWTDPVEVLLYTNHASENRYPFGPPGTAVSIPPWSGAPLKVEGVYSHPLDDEVRLRKLYALEAMHDLRLSPAEQEACGSPGAVRRRDDYPRTPEVDYFRRAVRPDEVFFRYDLDGLRELVRSFLEPVASPEG